MSNPMLDALFRRWLLSTQHAAHRTPAGPVLVLSNGIAALR